MIYSLYKTFGDSWKTMPAKTLMRMIAIMKGLEAEWKE